MTATVEPEDAEVTYAWYINGTLYADSESITVPAIAKSGDRIKVTVTDAEGNTATDTVYVGGFSILSIEPTTAMDGATGYKYVRATFSNALNSLTEADIEIRNVKTGQLYSVEKVALSTDGYKADITIAGDAAVAGTTFLQPSTIYSCTIDADGAESTLEFQLPNILSDRIVTSVDTEANTITVYGSVRAGQNLVDREVKYNVGDSYEENLGLLVGHTVVIGVDADNNVVSLKVNDGNEVFGYLKAKDGDSDGDFGSAKDYFETVSGDKYYLSTDRTSTANWTFAVGADNDGIWGYADDVVAKDATFEYGRLILNQNGTVSTAVLWSAFDGHIIVTEADGSVAKETSDNSKDFKGYTVISGDTFEYLDPTEIADGNIIYYDSNDKLAFIYNESVTGELETVYEDRVVVDGDKYNYIVKDTPGNVIKQARYYDADNDKYELVTEKWANTIDKDEPVTLYLDTKGDIVLVDATVGETVTHKKDYIITKSPKAYKNGLTPMMDMSVSDGTEVTLHIAAADITTINDKTFGDVSFSDTTGKFVFNILDGDGKKTDAAGKKNGTANADGDGPVASTVFQQGGLVEVIYNDDETKVVGLNMKLGAQNPEGYPKLRADADTEFKPGLASVKTTANGSLTLSADTKVYVLTGTRMPVGSVQNDTETDAGANTMKEATDNKVKVYDYADFELNTKPGSTKIKLITVEGAQTDGSAIEEDADGAENGPTISSLVTFVPDKTAAKAVIIDNRGWNNGLNTTVLPLIGSVGKVGDAKGGQVFKSAKTETKYLGVATGTEYKLNSDGETEQLAALTILTKDGNVDLDSFADKIDADDHDAKGKIVVAELDANGKVTKLTEGANVTNAAPEVDKVSYGTKAISTSTDTLTVNLNNAEYSVKTDANCLVVKFDGNKYSETTIGEINRDSSYKGIKFMTSQLNGNAVKATVILATKVPSGTAYTQVANSIVASATTIAVGQTATITLLDQCGIAMNQVAAATSGTPAVANFNGTNDNSVSTVTVEGLTVGSSIITVTGAGSAGNVTFTVEITVIDNA